MAQSNAAVEALTAQIAEKRAKLKKAQEMAAIVERLKTDIQALERSLLIMKGEEPPIGPPSIFTMSGYGTVGGSFRHGVPVRPAELEIDTVTPNLFRRETSIPDMVVAVLKQSGKPMRTDEIMAALLVHDKTLSRPSVMGAIYRNAKSGRLFRLVKPGIFALLGWEQ